MMITTPAHAQEPSSDTIKAMCQALQSSYKEMTEQFPIQLDFATKLIGASALHMSGDCYVNIHYLLLDGPFIDEMVESAKSEPDPFTHDEAVAFLNRVEGREMLEDQAKLRIRDGMSKLLDLPNIRLKVHYDTMGVIHPFSVELESPSLDSNTGTKKGPSF